MTITTLLTALWGYLLASFVLMLAVKVWARVTGRGCRPVATLGCVGVGIFIDSTHGRLSIFPLPCIGVLLDTSPARRVLRVTWKDGYSMYRLDGRYVIHWFEAMEGMHRINTIQALRAAYPGMTLNEAKELWDTRQAA